MSATRRLMRNGHDTSARPPTAVRKPAFYQRHAAARDCLSLIADSTTPFDAITRALRTASLAFAHCNSGAAPHAMLVLPIAAGALCAPTGRLCLREATMRLVTRKVDATSCRPRRHASTHERAISRRRRYSEAISPGRAGDGKLGHDILNTRCSMGEMPRADCR